VNRYFGAAKLLFRESRPVTQLPYDSFERGDAYDCDIVEVSSKKPLIPSICKIL